jgi:hypothetical protein
MMENLQIVEPRLRLTEQKILSLKLKVEKERRTRKELEFFLSGL